jgi:hypothetical protein
MRLPYVILKGAALPAFIGAFLLGGAVAGAGGTAVIRQIDGSLNTYSNVSVAIVHKNLFVSTHDGKGTLVIQKAACSYQGAIMVCFPTAITLVQGGSSRPLELRNGTIYLNLTGEAQSLAFSTQKVPAHSMLLSFTTKRGTYVGVTGRIDKVVE